MPLKITPPKTNWDLPHNLFNKFVNFVNEAYQKGHVLQAKYNPSRVHPFIAFTNWARDIGPFASHAFLCVLDIRSEISARHTVLTLRSVKLNGRSRGNLDNCLFTTPLTANPPSVKEIFTEYYQALTALGSPVLQGGSSDKDTPDNEFIYRASKAAKASDFIIDPTVGKKIMDSQPADDFKDYPVLGYFKPSTTYGQFGLSEDKPKYMEDQFITPAKRSANQAKPPRAASETRKKVTLLGQVYAQYGRPTYEAAFQQVLADNPKISDSEQLWLKYQAKVASMETNSQQPLAEKPTTVGKINLFIDQKLVITFQTQTEAAEWFQVSQVAISQYILGKSRLPLSNWELTRNTTPTPAKLEQAKVYQISYLPKVDQVTLQDVEDFMPNFPLTAEALYFELVNQKEQLVNLTRLREMTLRKVDLEADLSARERSAYYPIVRALIDNCKLSE